MSRWLNLPQLTLPVPGPMAVAIFFTIWWILLFAVLPFGVQSQHETAEIVPGSDPGAPIAPRLLAKALWTTGISVLAFVALMWLISATA
jgi:predicted secreted protein